MLDWTRIPPSGRIVILSIVYHPTNTLLPAKNELSAQDQDNTAGLGQSG